MVTKTRGRCGSFAEMSAGIAASLPAVTLLFLCTVVSAQQQQEVVPTALPTPLRTADECYINRPDGSNNTQ